MKNRGFTVQADSQRKQKQSDKSLTVDNDWSPNTAGSSRPRLARNQADGGGMNNVGFRFSGEMTSFKRSDVMQRVKTPIQQETNTADRLEGRYMAPYVFFFSPA